MRRNLRNRKNNRNKIMLILVIILGVSLAYAAISTTLKIDGSALVKKPTWSVYWDNPQVVEGSISNTPPTIGQDEGEAENTKATWNVTLDRPGDFYEFTIDAVNAGSIDAAIEDSSISPPAGLPEYIKYEITYADGQDIETGHLLPKAEDGVPTVETYRVRVEYDRSSATKETINNIPQGGNSYSFTAGVTYSQANSESYNRRTKTRLYALYTFPSSAGDYEHIDDDIEPYSYNINVGDVLPQSMASPGRTVTRNYNCGPTTNYRRLKAEYTRYSYLSEGSDYRDYYYNKNSCDESPHESTTCTSEKLSYSVPMFYGFDVDSSRVILNRYVCFIHNNKLTCLENNSSSSEYDITESFSSAAQKLVRAFGEYDSDTETGCYISSDTASCKSTDGKYEVTLNYSELQIMYWDKNIDKIFTFTNGYMSGPMQPKDYN